jgi:hypothetical protein
MVKYLQTTRGYFYKLLENGKHKRISQSEHKKRNKTRKNKNVIDGEKESLLASASSKSSKTPKSSKSSVSPKSVESSVSSKSSLPAPPPNPLLNQTQSGNHVEIPPIPPSSTEIEESDIMYQDELVCILQPEVKKGIIVYSRYVQPKDKDSLCKTGLKTGKKLQEEGINFGRRIFHPYIFFKAPSYSREIDYSTPETEINSLFGEVYNLMAYIRVDPDRTFVFSSEIRATLPDPSFDNEDGHLISAIEEIQSVNNNIRIKKMTRNDDRYKDLYNKYYNDELNKSKKTLTEYLKIIKINENYKYTTYDLYSSYKVNNSIVRYPNNDKPIERNSEILVSLPHLTPDYFVLCTD